VLRRYFARSSFYFPFARPLPLSHHPLVGSGRQIWGRSLGGIFAKCLCLAAGKVAKLKAATKYQSKQSQGSNQSKNR